MPPRIVSLEDRRFLARRKIRVTSGSIAKIILGILLVASTLYPVWSGLLWTQIISGTIMLCIGIGFIAWGFRR